MPAPPPPRPLVQTPGVLRWSPSVLRGPRPSQRPCSLDIVNSRPSLVYSNQSTPCTVSTVQCKLIQTLALYIVHCIQCTVSSALYLVHCIQCRLIQTLHCIHCPVQAHPALQYWASSVQGSSVQLLSLQSQYLSIARYSPVLLATSRTVCY